MCCKRISTRADRFGFVRAARAVGADRGFVDEQPELRERLGGQRAIRRRRQRQTRARIRSTNHGSGGDNCWNARENNAHCFPLQRQTIQCVSATQQCPNLNFDAFVFK